MDVVQAAHKSDAFCLPAKAERKVPRRGRQSLGDGVGSASAEDAANRLLKGHGVHTLLLEDQHEVHEIPAASRAATLVRAREGMQLFGDLPLQRHQQYLDRLETKSAQEPWPSAGLSIPWIGHTDADVYLDRLEWPSGQGARQFVSHGEADTRFAKFFACCDGEGEMIAKIFDCRPLEIRTGSFTPIHVIRIQID